MHSCVEALKITAGGEQLEYKGMEAMVLMAGKPEMHNRKRIWKRTASEYGLKLARVGWRSDNLNFKNANMSEEEWQLSNRWF